MEDIAAAVNATLGVARLKPGVIRKIIQSYTLNHKGAFVIFADWSPYNVTHWEEAESLMPGSVMLFAPTGEALAVPESFLDFLE